MGAMTQEILYCLELWGTVSTAIKGVHRIVGTSGNDSTSVPGVSVHRLSARKIAGVQTVGVHAASPALLQRPL